MGEDVAFWLIAITCVASALAVVLIKDLFRAALCLILCFVMVAGVYVTLNADLLAGLQILVYVGAIALLILFGVMFTRDAYQGNRFNKMALPVLVLAVVLMGVMIAAVVDADNFASVPPAPEQDTQLEEGEPTTSAIGRLLFSEDSGYLLAFEIAGVLLLAAVIGALVLVREREK